jgi:hypothetical protein
MPDTTAATPAADKLAVLIQKYHQLSNEIDAVAVEALRERTSRHYPDAVTLVLDSNGNPDEYSVYGLLTADGTPAESEDAAQEDETLDELIRNLPKSAVRYDRSTRLWHVALQEG